MLFTATRASAAWQRSAQTTHGGMTRPPIVSATDAPAGTEMLAVQWLKVAVPDLGVMLAAVARPSGDGPFPAVLLLHGTHGFAREYVRWAQDLARGGFLAVAACWFSGGGWAGAKFVSPPIPCPDTPPLTGRIPAGRATHRGPRASDARAARGTPRSTRTRRPLTGRRSNPAICAGEGRRSGPSRVIQAKVADGSLWRRWAFSVISRATVGRSTFASSKLLTSPVPAASTHSSRPPVSETPRRRSTFVNRRDRMLEA
jgi:hypothetical protein